MMRAYELHRFDGPSALRLVDAPEPSPGDDVLLDVHAIGINFPDLLATQGLHQHKPPLPYIPGCEIAGIVRAAPEASEWVPGQPAAAFLWQGGYAEVASVPAHSLVAVPYGTSLSTAAAMVVNYHTVLFGLDRRGHVSEGETVLVLGAAGGIGSAAIQVSHGLGARAIGGVANEEQRETALAAGADDVLVLEQGFSAAVRELTNGRGVDAVLDPLGDWLFDEALRALAPEGKIVIIGFAAGKIPELKVNRLLLRNASAVGVAWGAFLEIDGNYMGEAGRKVNRMMEAGAVDPPIGARYRFEELP
jgi:NADPH2:quinone reductase